jgi:hypothetical protein
LAYGEPVFDVQASTPAAAFAPISTVDMTGGFRPITGVRWGGSEYSILDWFNVKRYKVQR